MEHLLGYTDSLAGIVLIILACGYFIGSIPFGLVVGRLLTGQDVRSLGSGNIGATNVLRTGSKTAAALTLLCDVAKGTLPCLIFWQISPQPLASSFALIAGFAAVLGHTFPYWLQFQGGKGVATALGVIAVLQPETFLVVVGLWLVIAATLRYASLASISAFVALPLVTLLLNQGLGAVVVFTALAILVISRHRENIHRLIAGNEHQIALLKVPLRKSPRQKADPDPNNSNKTPAFVMSNSAPDALGSKTSVDGLSPQPQPPPFRRSIPRLNDE